MVNDITTAWNPNTGQYSIMVNLDPTESIILAERPTFAEALELAGSLQAFT